MRFNLREKFKVEFKLIKEKGAIYTVKVITAEDLDRQLIKSQSAELVIPEFTLTIPPSKGQLTTIEGILQDTISDLSFEQPARQHIQPEVYEKIEALLNKLRTVVDHDGNNFPNFTVRLDDPSGNSYLEAVGGLDDAQWNKTEYARTAQQDQHLGLQSEDVPDEVIVFPTTCSSCSANIETRMTKVDIPHFKEVFLMSTNCDYCGYRDNEIKSGGAVAPRARKIILKIVDADDLTRDILKSDTASLTIPEIDLHLNPGTLGGRFTTVEGILNLVYEELDTKVVFESEDGPEDEKQSTMASFLLKLKKAMTASIPFTLILDDPVSNSFIQNIYAPDPDPNMQTEEYDRTFEQNEELGLNDINVDNYEKP